MNFLVKVFTVTVVFSQSNVQSAPRLPRLSVAESAPSSYYYNNNQGDAGAYSFNYDISDGPTGNTQYRTEDRYSNGTVVGAYGYVDSFGTPQRFRYIADKGGYRVFKDYLNYYYPTTTVKPLDKFANTPLAPEVTWTRPKRPNKKKGNQPTNNQRRNYNLIGPPSLYIPRDNYY